MQLLKLLELEKSDIVIDLASPQRSVGSSQVPQQDLKVLTPSKGPSPSAVLSPLRGLPPAQGGEVTPTEADASTCPKQNPEDPAPLVSKSLCSKPLLTRAMQRELTEFKKRKVGGAHEQQEETGAAAKRGRGRTGGPRRGLSKFSAGTAAKTRTRTKATAKPKAKSSHAKPKNKQKPVCKAKPKATAKSQAKGKPKAKATAKASAEPKRKPGGRPCKHVVGAEFPDFDRFFDMSTKSGQDLWQTGGVLYYGAVPEEEKEKLKQEMAHSPKCLCLHYFERMFFVYFERRRETGVVNI